MKNIIIKKKVQRKKNFEENIYLISSISVARFSHLDRNNCRYLSPIKIALESLCSWYTAPSVSAAQEILWADRAIMSNR